MKHKAVLLALFAALALGQPADSPFLEKQNAFAKQFNQLMNELQANRADLKQFRKTAQLWDKLYADSGWLK